MDKEIQHKLLRTSMKSETNQRTIIINISEAKHYMSQFYFHEQICTIRSTKKYNNVVFSIIDEIREK